MLKVDLTLRRPGFTLRAEFAAPTPGVVALFGRSGCGKSTLVDLLSGLLQPDEGFVQLEDTVLTDTRCGVHVPVERRRIGYVFQDPRLFPHFTILGNLLYGRRRAPATSQIIALEEVIELLGIGALLKRRPHELSGGERQRVSLGRALLSQPRLLLLDEPFAALDGPRRRDVLPYLEALRDRLSIPMVYVSHQFEDVVRLATHVVVMDGGSVVARGTLNEVSLLPQLRTIIGPDLVGAVLEGTLQNTVTGHGLAQLKLGSGIFHLPVQQVQAGTRLRVQILARDIILATELPRAVSLRNALAGRIVSLADDDEDGAAEAVLVRVDIGGATLLARVTREAVEKLVLRPGASVWALVKSVSVQGYRVGQAHSPS